MTWQKQLQKAIKQPHQLIEQLDLSHHIDEISDEAQKTFSLLATDSYISNIQANDPDDPLLLQILPSVKEETKTPAFVKDPVGDLLAEKSPGLLHKYQGRVLLVMTGACPIHCRFCFRRHYPYAKSSITAQQMASAIDYIQKNTDISEVILSGGDPLVLSDEKLSSVITQLESIKHVKRLRIHTRTPIVLPERVLESDLSWLMQTKLKSIVVLHCNHANEINTDVIQASKKLAQAGALLLNQSVLLKGVNDNCESLVKLSETLYELDIRPYYLHLLDKVEGAEHFEVDEVTAQILHQELRNQLPGYLVPLLVKEQAGFKSKTPV